MDAQLLAAKFSYTRTDDINNADVPPVVADAIADADVFRATHDCHDWNSLTKAEKNQVNAWATLFDQYNNGLIEGWPQHCEIRAAAPQPKAPSVSTVTAPKVKPKIQLKLS